jgi:hypothetical protein
MVKSRIELRKPHRALGLCAAAAFAQVAMADQPAINAAALGITEATLDFCAQADPKSADQYWQQAKALLQAVPAKTAAEIRKSDEYRAAYDSAAAAISEVPRQDALRACTDSLVASR